MFFAATRPGLFALAALESLQDLVAYRCALKSSTCSLLRLPPLASLLHQRRPISVWSACHTNRPDLDVCESDQVCAREKKREKESRELEGTPGNACASTHSLARRHLFRCPSRLTLFFPFASKPTTHHASSPLANRSSTFAAPDQRTRASHPHAHHHPACQCASLPLGETPPPPRQAHSHLRISYLS